MLACSSDVIHPATYAAGSETIQPGIAMPIIVSRRRVMSGAALLAFVLVAGAGCGEPGVKRVTVNGTVAYKGQTLSSGMLQFVGPEGSYSASVVQPDGTYIMTDVLPGEVKVGVMAT